MTTFAINTMKAIFESDNGYISTIAYKTLKIKHLSY